MDDEITIRQAQVYSHAIAGGLLRDLGDRLVASVAIYLLWEFHGKQAIMEEIEGKLNLVPTENSVPINQHPYGTLIADLVDALSLLASTSESKWWQSLPRPFVECI